MPSSFRLVPLHGLMAGTRGSLGRNYPLPILRRWHPRALHCLRAYQLPKLGSALPGDFPSTLTWQAGTPGPFPGYPRPMHCPRGQWCPGPRIMRATHAHYAIPAPHGPLAYRGRLARCPHSAILTVRSHAPNPSTGLLHPSKRVSSLRSHQQQNDFHFVNLTNPLTHISLTPGSLGRESLLPPITHRTMHSTFAPFTQTRWPHSLNVFISLSTLLNSHIAELCHPSCYIP